MVKKVVSFCLFTTFLFSLLFTPVSRINQTNASQVAEDVWTSLSNGLEGGCISAIVADPIVDDFFYAGTAEHGVFESEDGGLNWTSISKDLENKMVSALAWYKKTLYVGTFQDLFRTSDHGKTWEKAEGKFPKINSIAIAGDMIYLGTNVGLYRSKDKHNMFKIFEVTDPEIKGETVLSVATHGANPSVVFISTLFKGIFGTTNGGANWYKVTNMLPLNPAIKVFFDPQNEKILYAVLEDQGVWLYEYAEAAVKNNSRDWVKVCDLKGFMVQNAVITSKTNEIYIGSKKDGAYLLKIDTKLVTKLPIPDSYYCITSMDIGNNTLIIGTAGKGCLRSTDRGAKWEVINFGINAVKILNLIIDPQNQSKWIATSFGCNFITNDSGATWVRVIQGLPEVLLTCIAFQPQNSQFLMAGTEESGLYESFDGGMSWEKNKNLNYSRITCILMDPGPTGKVYVGTLAKGVYYSSDKGKSWLSLDLGTKKDQKGNPTDSITALTVDPTNPNILYVGTNINGIFKSIDAGKTWSHIYEVLGTDIYINDIQVDKNNNRVIYAGVKIINDGGFIKSEDQGETWESTNLYRGGMVFKTICIDDHESSIVFCGTTDGVYYTKDTGYHWYNYDTGLDKVFKMYLNQFPINRILQDPKTENKIIIATHWGIYECLKSKKVLDKILPKIIIEEPPTNNIFTKNGKITIKGKAEDAFGIETILVNGNPIEFGNFGIFSFDRDLRLGENEFIIQAMDVSKNVSEEKINVFLDQIIPVLDIQSPLNFTTLSENHVLIKGSATDHQSGVEKLLVNGQEIQSLIKAEGGYFEYDYQGLKIGKNLIEIKLIDKAGNEVKKELELTLELVDQIPPRIELINPDKELTNTNVKTLVIQGTVTDEGSGVFRIKINNTNVEFDNQGKFSYSTDLKEGKNDFTITVSDMKGNETVKVFELVLDSIPPKISPSNLAINMDTNTSNKNFIIKFGVADQGLGVKSIQLFINDTIQTELAEPKEASFEIPVELSKGQTAIKIVATDQVGNSSEFKNKINYVPPVLIKLQIGNKNVYITRDNNIEEYTIDAAPMIYQKRTMVPLRFLSEAFEATVTWLPKPIEEAKITYQDKFIIYLKPWNKVARIEYPPESGKPAEKITLDAPPIIANSRTFVPLRFISDMFGAKVNWDGKTQTIELTWAKY